MSASGQSRIRLRLYVAGDGPNSQLALTNLTRVCQERLADRCDLEVVDVLRDPARAAQDRVLLTPLLVRLAPTPIRRVTGNLSQTDVLLHALDLEAPL